MKIIHSMHFHTHHITIQPVTESST